MKSFATSRALSLAALALSLMGCPSQEPSFGCPGSGTPHSDGVGRYCAYGVVIGGFDCPAEFPNRLDFAAGGGAPPGVVCADRPVRRETLPRAACQDVPACAMTLLADAGPSDALPLDAIPTPTCGVRLGTNDAEECGTARDPGGSCVGDRFRCAASQGDSCDCVDARCPELPERGQPCDASLAGVRCGVGFENPGLVCQAEGSGFAFRYHENDVPGCDELWFSRSTFGPPWLCPPPETINAGERCCYLPYQPGGGGGAIGTNACPGADGAMYSCPGFGSMTWSRVP